MPPVNNLGKRLKALRGEMSLYQAEKSSGIPRSRLSRYERGVLVPEIKMLKQLADFYRVDVQELKELCFEDLYPAESDERESLLVWVRKIL